MNISTIHLVLLIAAVWRLANLLANEDGPFHFFKTLRSKLARAEVRSRRKNGLLSKLQEDHVFLERPVRQTSTQEAMRFARELYETQ